MTYDQMLQHCKAGGKAQRAAWTSGAKVFIEGTILGVLTPFDLGRRIKTTGYVATISERNACDWEPA